MATVTGLGGAFIRAKDPETLYKWYEEHLGMARFKGFFAFPAEQERGKIVLAFVKHEGEQKAVVNLQVDDLDAILTKLRHAGAEVDPKTEDYGFGKFGWFNDPEGNRIELWQPPAGK